uniref:VPS37C subunit of ESCRT-I n=1 Tax=Tetraodon nigroviridis TaxID=99883 RepID=H3C5F9_TETNG
MANQMDKLQDLSQSELQELLDNPERVDSMALESDEIQNIQLEREMALASNRSLAEQNLDMKPRLESQKEVLVERYSQLQSVRENYLKHCSLRDGMAGQVSPEALLSRLQTEGGKTEAESETLADEYLEGSLPLDSFLDQFLSLRSLAHKRRVRIERLQEMLRQNYPDTMQPTPSAGGCSGLPYSPYPATTPNPTPVAAGSGPANTPPQFPPYPGSGSSFTPAGSYSSAQPAFGPVAPSVCPYPSQPSFPAPQPHSAFGQYTPVNPQSGSVAYPASYNYGGYSYPTRPAYSSS